jgi:DNA-binding MarR family transcriptional regulator
MARKAELAEETWEAFTRLMKVFRESFLAIGVELALTPGEVRALEALDPAQSRPMRALATELRCDASNVTWLVDRLETRGYVERQASPDDRRVKTLSLTPAGLEARERIAESMRRPPAPLLALSVAELTTLRELLDRCGADRQAELIR